MTDLVSGRYQKKDPLWTAIGRPANALQVSQAARSNLWLFKLGTVSDGALAATEVACVVAVPVQEGDVFTKVTMLVGGTAGKEVEAGFAALYEGLAKPEAAKLLAQSKSLKFEATMKKETPFTFELEKEVAVNATNCPNGYLWAAVAVESPTGVAGVIPTVMSQAVPKACQYKYFGTTTGSPEVLVGTAGAGLKTAAAAEIGATTSAASAPILFLS